MAYDGKGDVIVVKVTASRLPSFPPGTKIDPTMVEDSTIDVQVFHRQGE